MLESDWLESDWLESDWLESDWLESDWLMNILRCAIIFREIHGERSDRITCKYHFAE